MLPLILGTAIALILAIAIVVYMSFGAARQRQLAEAESTAGAQLAPWEVDQYLPTVPADLTTNAIPVVPIPSTRTLTKDDVVDSYPAANTPAHEHFREFFVKSEYQAPRHGR